MKPRDLRQLLGGFAAGTLSAEEREALFQAALEDQVLFDALADEEALRELLADPLARAQLRADLEPAPPASWWNWVTRPATLGIAGSLATLLVVVGIIRQPPPEMPPPTLVAQAPAAPPVAKSVRRAPPPPAREEREAERPAPAAPPAPPPAPSPSLSAVILCQVEGDWRQAPPGIAFREGDEVRLRVRAAEDGHVIAAAQDGSRVTLLGPALGTPVRAGEDLVFPLTLAGDSGEKLLKVSFTAGALPAPEVGMQFARREAAATARPAAVAEKVADQAAAKSVAPAQEVEIRLRYRPPR